MNKTQNYLEQSGINGNVKSIETKTYYISRKSGEIKKGKLKENSLTTFNEQGNLLDDIYKNANNHIQIKNRYDSGGNLKEELGEINLELGANLDKGIYELKYKHTYKYDSKGNLIGKYSYNSKGNLIQKEIYKYNSEGKEIEYYYYFKEKMVNMNTHKYNLHNNLIETNNFALDNKLIKRLIYRYDANGNKTEFIYDSIGELQERNLYNRKGEIVENYIINSKGNLYLKNQSNYDSNGNLVERYSYDSNNNIINKEAHNYEFDQKGNWIKDIILKSKRGSEIIIRKIKYF